MVKQHRDYWFKTVKFFRKRELLALLLGIFCLIFVVPLWQRLLIQIPGLLTQVVLIAGLLVVVTLTLSIYFTLAMKASNQQITAINQELTHRIFEQKQVVEKLCLGAGKTSGRSRESGKK